MNHIEILRIISNLEGAYHHLRVNDFDEDRDIIREMCDGYYKLYVKTCKAKGLKPYG